MRRLFVLAAIAGLSLVPAAAQAAAPTALPTISRTLTAAGKTSRFCDTLAPRAGRGIALSSYQAPMSGYVSVRLLGRDTSDWDLNLIDAANGRRLQSSQGFGSHEVAQSWVVAGQPLTIMACHRSGRARSVRMTIDFIDAAPPKIAGTPTLVRVSGNQQQISRLDESQVDVTENRGMGWADVLASGADQVAALTRTGLKVRTLIPDMNAFALRSEQADARASATATSSPLPSGRRTYRTFDDVQTELKALVKAHPSTVRPVVIGHSYQGRELAGVEIADNVAAKDDGRPVFFLMAMHHAREWPSVEAAMEYATMLANAPSTDTRLAGLRKRERTVIVPVINPDGYISTRNAAPIDPADNARDQQNGQEQGVVYPPSTIESIAPPGGILAYRRKTCAGEVPNPNVPCELQWGVDPNRNYGQLWGGNGASPDPTSQSYHGPGPWSEPETQAVHAYSQTHQVTALITLHNVAALVLRPPGLHNAGLAPDEKRLKAVGDAMANETGYTSEYGFQLYDTAGTTEDWNYAAQGAFGYTIEMGPENGSFHMPYQIGFINEWTGRNRAAQRHNGKGLREALLIAATEAANSADHGILTGRARPGATLHLSRKFKTTTSAYCVMGVDPVVNVIGEPQCAGDVQPPRSIADKLDTSLVVPKSGIYTWHVDPSTRPFVGAPTVTTIVDTKPSKTDTYNVSAGQTEPNQLPDQGKPTYVDHKFTIATTDKKVDVDLTFPNKAEDYDLEVYRCVNACGGSDDANVGNSAGANGQQEHVSIEGTNVKPGAYYARAINYLGPTSTWTVTVTHFGGKTTVTPGHTEAWTLTCTSGSKTLSSRQVTIGRGQKLTVNACGA